jgi:SMI1-KNR4 cell-wall
MKWFNWNQKSKLQPKATNIDELILKFSHHFGVSIDEIQGCTEEEILQAENKLGRFPTLYREIMKKVGKGFKHINKNRIDFDFFLDDAIESSNIARELSPDGGLYENQCPKNLFIIYQIHSGDMYFILLDENNYDAPVFIEDFSRGDNQEFILVKAYESLWDWINDFLDGRYNFILYRSDEL